MDGLKKHEVNFHSLGFLFTYLFFYPIILYNLGFTFLSAFKRPSQIFY
jgi:hypothetical protein